MSDQYQQGQNYFPPLTPEQQAEIQRQAVQSGISPFELMSIIAGGPGAGLMYGVGRAMGLGRIPSAIGGAGFGAGIVELGQRYGERIRDAEGQLGGFYGEDPRRRIARELMK